MTTQHLFRTAFLVTVLSALAFGQHSEPELRLLAAKHSLAEGDNSSKSGSYLHAKALLTDCTPGGMHQALVEYYLGYADYRLGVVVYRMDKEKSIAYLDSAVEHLDRAIGLQKSFAEAHALLSSCYGIKISYAPLKGLALGPKASSAMEKARDLAPGNPRVALLDAIRIFNTPSLFGGSKEEGLQKMQKAAELFDRWVPPDSLAPDWGKAEVYAWIGLAHLDRKESILARKAFERALQIDPDYGWVKYGLLPKISTRQQGGE
jgi:tetratricopeptide (TPR) repeat protein